ncbi:hypothetical protein [Flavobacterium hydatis]|uniref:Type I restriction enzyme R protein N-terminal domain-containing protein n=1 Tax=Flavobacterium hydatis TaxID=991 RepID=A0A086AQ65_FLAHY|nr:hypothetical protein [Flavobacterium hydatis]KFF18829.1 hypothetical protein IW20_04475 [Flavobacterium hydatis]OXA88756.1 hypothetical protein B0A62_21160 [Flavobacterium hydatis]
MQQPTEKQIEFIKTLLATSIDQLIVNDSDIFNLDIVMPQQISPDARILNRELHETTINHRLAFYLENNLMGTEYDFYKVDIEYNRFYGNPKMLQTVDGIQAVRPDILIHARINDQVAQQHLLIVEAKKGRITDHDTNKVKGFISDRNYYYLFGLTISYCSSHTQVLANLYYFDGNVMKNIPVNREKEIA